MNTDTSLRDHLLYLLGHGGAHIRLAEVIDGFPFEYAGARVEGAPYTAWQLLDHLRLAQRDILEFSRNPDHVSPDFPDGYWPDSEAPPDRKTWEDTLSQIKADLEAMKDLVADQAIDLHAEIPHGSGQTVLREALLVADHNAYHLGQIVLLRRILEGAK
jgi:hypothetical protein